MLEIGVKVEKISLDIKTPTDRRFWTAVGTQVVREIRKQTESGKDYQGSKFIPYNEVYAQFRKDKGRNTRPNLLFSGRMLNAMSRGIRPYGGVLNTKAGVKLIMSGEDGLKAWGNEENGREFFDISKASTIKILKSVDAFLVKSNGLK